MSLGLIYLLLMEICLNIEVPYLYEVFMGTTHSTSSLLTVKVLSGIISKRTT